MADKAMVFSTRSLAWPREVAITSLVATRARPVLLTEGWAWAAIPVWESVSYHALPRVRHLFHPSEVSLSKGGGQIMTPRTGKKFRSSAQAENLAITHRHAAGIDIHAREHFVAVAAGTCRRASSIPIRSCRRGKLPTLEHVPARAGRPRHRTRPLQTAVRHSRRPRGGGCC